MKAFENNLLRPTFEIHQSFRGIQIDYSLGINPFSRIFYRADFEAAFLSRFFFASFYLPFFLFFFQCEYISISSRVSGIFYVLLLLIIRPPLDSVGHFSHPNPFYDLEALCMLMTLCLQIEI